MKNEIVVSVYGNPTISSFRIAKLAGKTHKEVLDHIGWIEQIKGKKFTKVSYKDAGEEKCIDERYYLTFDEYIDICSVDDGYSIILPDNFNEAEREIEEQRPFDNDQLLLTWMSMCNRMPRQMAGLAARMKNMTPHIEQFPNVVVAVGNQLLLDQMESIKNTVRYTLVKSLHNSSITLEFRITKYAIEHIEASLASLRKQISQTTDMARMMELMMYYKELQLIRNNMYKDIRN